MDKAQDDRRYFGKFRGIVKDNDDPRRLGRLRVQLPEIFGVEFLTDWAWPVLPYGGIPDNGFFVVPELESGVFVEFESGNVDRPLWTGVWWSEPEGVPETPKLAREEKDETTEEPKGTDEAETADGKTIKEPESPYAARYPHNKVWKTSTGIVIELDDTEEENDQGEKESKVRLHFWHPTATYLEVAPDGSVRRRVQAKRFLVVELDDEIHVKGTRHVVIDGDATLKVGGNYTILVEGDKKETIRGNVTQKIEGTRQVEIAGDDTREVEGKITDSADEIHHN